MMYVKLAILFPFLLSLLTSCNPTTIPASNRIDENFIDSGLVSRAYVYDDNPIAITGNEALGLPLNYGRLTNFESPQRITPDDKSTLLNDCLFDQLIYPSTSQTSEVTDCLKVLNSEDPSETILQKTNGNWVYDLGSDEFYQVNGMYHMNKATERFLEALNFAHTYSHFNSNLSIPPSIPYDLRNMKTYWFKYNASISEDTVRSQLVLYTNCNVELGAYFSPAEHIVCLGKDSSSPDFRFIQDPSILYHEMAHAFVKIMSNLRNAEFNVALNDYLPTPYTSNLRSSLGGSDEAASINEGIADYFSYVMNGRSKVFEWGAGRFFDLARPVRENDGLHSAGISETANERLRYPDYLYYDPNSPQEKIEDVHNAGQNTSHYLVALTENLKSECSINHKTATNYVFLALTETLSELGDLLAEGSDYNFLGGKYFNNLNPDKSYEWSYIVNPANNRTFYQLMAKNIYHHLSLNLCPAFSKDDSEKLLDQYGLLLFKHYNDDGTLTDGTGNYASITGSNFSGFRTFTSLGSRTNVDEANRVRTALVAKDLIELPDASVEAIGDLDDSRAGIEPLLTQAVFQGKVISLSSGLAGVEYNNSNGKISPGEIVAISPTILNQSNNSISGVHILANDWDHMKILDQTTGELAPCIFDGFPLVSEGGIAEDDPNTQGNCSYVSRDGASFQQTAGSYPADALHPVCLVQLSDEDETLWVSQDEFRQHPNYLLEDQNCLNNTSTNYNPNECLVRFLPGFQQAYHSKIDPLSSYKETIQDGIEVRKQKNSAFLLMEVSKEVPPGTVFNCRLRVKFSNCSNCYEDSSSATTPKDDLADYSYAGPDPYKLLNFKFTVTN